jgi:uncharacterized protein
MDDILCTAEIHGVFVQTFRPFGAKKRGYSMPVDDDTQKLIGRAFADNDVAEFSEYMRRYPELLRHEDGTEQWMWRAAQNGRLDMVKELVKLGIDVNESKDLPDVDNPNSWFYQAEGAILNAASQGHLEVVRWLLEQGAKINYVVGDKPRCYPLLFAVGSGHLDVVKLLVEHGADIHFKWNGNNPITHAEDQGELEIRDYLASLGAKTLRETTPPDYPRSHKRFKKSVVEKYGPTDDWTLEFGGSPPVMLHHVPASKKSKLQVLFTVGLSDKPLARDGKPLAFTELNLLLPPKWPLTAVALKNPKKNWPIKWFKMVVAELQAAKAWPDQPVLYSNDGPLSPDTKLCGWVLLEAVGQTVHAPDYRWIDVHTLFPVYAEEMELVRKSGTEELVNRFGDMDIPLSLDLNRPNVAVE